MNVGALDGWPAAGDRGRRRARGRPARPQRGARRLPGAVAHRQGRGSGGQDAERPRRHVAGEAGDRGDGRFAAHARRAGRRTARRPRRIAMRLVRRRPLSRCRGGGGRRRRCRTLRGDPSGRVRALGDHRHARRDVPGAAQLRVARGRRRALQAALGKRDRRGPGRQGRRRRAGARQRGGQRGGRGLQRPVRVRWPEAQCRPAAGRCRARRAWLRGHRRRLRDGRTAACSPSAPCARAMAAG